MRVVAALGGNALLQRGEPPDSDVQQAHIADAVNATVIPLDRAPEGYRDFDQGAARKFIIDPHGMVPA